MKRFASLVVLALLAVACRTTTPTSQPSPSPSVTPSDAQPVAVTVYYLIEFDGRVFLNPEVREIVDDEFGVARVEELIDGTPQDPDLFSAYPEEARVLGITIEDGTATVDWNAGVLEADVGAEREELGIQQVVWTLTEVPDIERVAFTVEGESEGEAFTGRVIEDWWGHVGLSDQPFTRSEDFIVAPITIDDPTEGATTSGTVTVSGTAQVFEANVQWRLIDASGAVVTDGFTTASAGAPQRGGWADTISLPSVDEPQIMTIEAFELSAEDGSELFVQTRHIEVVP
jgi:hypothetical protein